MVLVRRVALLLLPIALTAAEIPPGTHVLLRMVNSVSTRSAQVGDYVYLRTASPIAINGEIIVPVDSYVQGEVSHSDRSGRVHGRARIGIRLETLTLASGKMLKFNPHLSSVDSNEQEQSVDRKESMVQQKPERLKDAGQVAILAGTGAAIGGMAAQSVRGAGIGGGVGGAVGLATVLLSRGKEVELRQGTTLDVVFDRPVVIE